MPSLCLPGCVDLSTNYTYFMLLILILNILSFLNTDQIQRHLETIL